MLGTVDIKVRPLKLALLIDPGSANQVRDAIQLASSLWGGMFFPIIPIYRRMPASWRESAIKAPLAKDVVQGYLDAFDPDVLVQFSAELPAYIKESQLQIIKPKDIWEGRSRNREIDPTLGIGVLDILSAVFEECFKYKARYPLKAIIPEIPKQFGLFWASVFGEYPSHISEAIDLHFAEPLEIERPKVTPEAFLDLTGEMVLFPRRATMWDLEPHERHRFGHGACIYFMDAGEIEDIVDYWNLRATGRNVQPLPKQFLQQESFKKAICEFLLRERHVRPNNLNIYNDAPFIRSRHSTMEEISAFTKTLNIDETISNENDAHHFSIQHWYPRIWDQWARGKDGGVVDQYGTDEDSIDIASEAELDMRIKPLTPKFRKESWFRSDGLCANEFDFRMYGANEHLAEVYPKAHGENLLNAISGITGARGEWRIGRNGLVKIVQSLTREPRKVPSSEEVFFAWLADHGWKAELSPPGILAKQIYKKLGGNPLLIANKPVLGLIEHMNGGSVNKNGTPMRDNRIGGERELPVGTVKSLLSDSKKSSSRYDYFIERGVFKLGWKTKCPNCQRSTWFALPTLRESMECPKCLTSFTAAGNIEQTGNGWYYRTTGPFSVPNYADGAFAVLLTLDAIGDRMFSFLRTTSVPSFVATSPEKPNLEADLAMFWKDSLHGEDAEGLLFGECKTYGLFEVKDFKRMQYLANSFPGAVLVFSTLRESLTKREISALTRLTKAGRKYWKSERPINPVLILTSNELLTTKRPPYCWDESLQKRFSHVHDLLSLCDATQKIYLRLPS
ncbi:MAG: hypothetical protein JWQ10_4226 [Herbaspirillum sp.]|nr:hypothetical protein [Herbaspirillum sp.]